MEKQSKMENLGIDKQLQNCYQGKKVFVTGHTGFKGSWLILMLSRLGAILKGYALEAEERSLFNDIEGYQYGESVIADIRDKRRLKDEIMAFQPDFIFHLAAQPLVLSSYQNPVYTYETNVMGTVHLLDAVQYLDKKCRIIMITTDKVYENKEWLYPYRETDRLGGFDPYSSSKACTEIAIDSFRNSFFPLEKYQEHRKAIAVVRAGNVIGGGDWAENRIIPDIARALNQNKVIEVRNPKAVRPWQHVLEALFGYLQIGVKLAEEKDLELWGNAWNFGPLYDEHVEVGQLVEKAIEVWGRGEYKVVNMKQPHEANLLRLDCSKAAKLLGWKPKKNAMDAIAFTIEWYKAILDDQHNPKEFTLKQINDYLS